MLDLRTVDSSFTDLVARIIRNSFRQQAELLGVSQDTLPNFVAFEGPDNVRRDLDNGHTLVLAYLDNVPVGTVRYVQNTKDPQLGHIRRLAVLPEHRGHNYGEALMSFAETKLRDLGVTRIEIGTVGQFHRLHAFYERLGFRELRRFTPPSLPFEVLVMEKHLTG